jgi:hypothetical protein
VVDVSDDGEVSNFIDRGHSVSKRRNEEQKKPR